MHAAFEVHARRVNFGCMPLYKEVHAAVAMDRSLIYVCVRVFVYMCDDF